MSEPKVRKVDSPVGGILPGEGIDDVQTEAGDTNNLTSCDPGFEEKMAKVGDIISRYRNALHVLAK